MNKKDYERYKDVPILLIQLEDFKFPLTERSISKHAPQYSGCYGACVLTADDGMFVEVFPGVDIDAGLNEIIETIKNLKNNGCKKFEACYTKSFTFLNLKRKINPLSEKSARILGAALTAFYGDYRGCNIFCSGVSELLVQIRSTSNPNGGMDFVMIHDAWEDEFGDLPELIKAACERRPNTVSGHNNSI